ncbi:MAG TPA: alpha/beta family hydrolase [Terriglobales bacterium]
MEYILNEDEAAPHPPARAAVVCHPHPLYGGTMHTKIVFWTAQVLARRGWPVLRFNFRGVGQSAGVHDRGVGEQQDLEAAIAFLHSRYAVPLVLAGFSFGAATLVRSLAARPHAETAQAVLLGLPVNGGALPTAWAWQGPKLMISGDQDEFGALPALESWYQALPEPKARVWIPGGDHFMSGHAEAFRAALNAWLPTPA